MAKYFIHTCNQRRWYVNTFLIPEMLEQGIKRADITVVVDSRNEGILMSTMKSFDYIGRTEDWDAGVWHLQDDIVLSSTFKERTEQLYGKLICGFCSNYDESKKFGLVDLQDMWYSFPCIYINNFLAKECANWFFSSALYEEKYSDYVSKKKYVDTMFKIYLKELHPDAKAFNVKPNLVDHVDYLIGGSLINYQRQEKQVRAYYWTENDVIRRLESMLQDGKS